MGRVCYSLIHPVLIVEDRRLKLFYKGRSKGSIRGYNSICGIAYILFYALLVSGDNIYI